MTEKRKKRNGARQFAGEVVISTLICIVIFSFVRPATVKQDSMQPTFDDGNRVLCVKLISDPNRGDIVIFKTNEGENYIKRIIGLPGETIKIQDGEIYINGKKQKQTYTKDNRTGGNIECKIPDDEYFVLGDNREVSIDSRDFGTIKREQIKLKVVLSLLPPKKVESI